MSISLVRKMLLLKNSQLPRILFEARAPGQSSAFGALKCNMYIVCIQRSWWIMGRTRFYGMDTMVWKLPYFNKKRRKGERGKWEASKKIRSKAFFFILFFKIWKIIYPNIFGPLQFQVSEDNTSISPWQQTRNLHYCYFIHFAIFIHFCTNGHTYIFILFFISANFHLQRL